MTAQLEEVLTRLGPQRSSVLVRALCDSGLSKAAAYKQLQRAQHPVQRLEHLNIERRERLFYLDSHDGLTRWQALIAAARDASASFHNGLDTLTALGGAVEERRFPIISGVEQGRQRRRSATDLATELLQDGIIERLKVPGRGPFLVRSDAFGGIAPLEARLAARGVIEDTMRGAVVEWIRRNGLGSFDRVAQLSDDTTPVVGPFAWDITAPSYLWPLVPGPRSFYREGLRGRHRREIRRNASSHRRSRQPFRRTPRPVRAHRAEPDRLGSLGAACPHCSSCGARQVQPGDCWGTGGG